MRNLDWWGRLFWIGVIGKGLDGLAEVIGGLLLLFASPGTLNNLVLLLTREELSEDPTDFIATHLLHVASGLTDQGITFAAVYLLIHGAVKILLVTALLRKQFWAYPWMIAMLLAFIAFQGYELVVAPTGGLWALTIFDVAVTVLTWHEYRRHKRRHDLASDPAHHAESS
ncbi:DUF2127 domain-containing protein [Arthrobacter sp. AQ5-05]|uniref:DUF2127 domain-containing protein n=1 Tax=Arthrobacter sp. AQ5-05 TaxID=2184581 RepID=UPI0015EC0E59|nr:DUF2127 domain-containing protein [Arthrobacter sp. AQ5-05]